MTPRCRFGQLVRVVVPFAITGWGALHSLFASLMTHLAKACINISLYKLGNSEIKKLIQSHTVYEC